MGGRRGPKSAGLALFLLIGLLLTGCGGGAEESAPEGDEAASRGQTDQAAASDGAAASGGTVRIGLIEPLTGPAAYYGERIEQGVRLAAQKINAEGGIDGNMIEIVTEDNQTDNAQTVSLYRKLASEEDIVAVIGPTHSANFLAGAPLAPELGVIWFSAGSGAPWPDGLPNEWNFRNTVPFVEMIPQHLENVIPQLGVDRVGAVFSPDNPGVAGPQQLGTAKLEELGVEQSPIVQAPTGTTDFGPQITQLLQDPPEVVLVNLVTEDAATFMRQARERGLESQFVAGHNGLLDLRILELSQGAADGLIVPSHFDPDVDRPEVKDFLQAWEEENGELDDFLVTYGYDAVYILKEALENAGGVTDREAVREALGQIEDLCLASGCYTWDGFGDRLGAEVFPVQMTSEGFRAWEA